MDVLVIGAGPVGLMLATELRLAGARPVVLDRRSEPGDTPKANGIGGQIVRILEHRGLLERFAARGSFAGPVPGFPFGPVPLRFTGEHHDRLWMVAIQQPEMERVLAERLTELGGAIEWGHELLALTQDADGVTAEVATPTGPRRLRADHLVGCDGARSRVRELVGIDFPGTTDEEVLRLGHFAGPGTGLFDEVEMAGLGPGWNRTAHGRVLVTSLRPDVHVVGVREVGRPADGPVSPEDFRAAVRRVLGADLPLGEPIWLSSTVSQARLAQRYRSGRVLLAGDAAHLFPAGGASLNVGLTDAVDLGWKLRDGAPETLLDSYDAERRPAAARALMYTRAQAHLERSADEEGAAVIELLTELAGRPEVSGHLGELLAGSDVRYDMPGADPHPLLGRLVPDLELTVDGRRTRVADLLRTARPLLLDLGDDPTLRAAAAGRVDVVSARCPHPPAPALLIRPDGWVAWAGSPDPEAALTTWFGPADRTAVVVGHG
jgi:2-polyprenyl-6-methoxyphenol hydroxylase-like FAD-dependent oxidoreductase